MFAEKVASVVRQENFVKLVLCMAVGLSTVGVGVCGVSHPASRANAPLPQEADADAMSLEGAWHYQGRTRERYSLNGLWHCRPACTNEPTDYLPGAEDAWGWGKIPHVWARWNDGPLADSGVRAAAFRRCSLQEFVANRVWYERIFRMPSTVAGRRVLITFTALSTRVRVFVDGVFAGACNFPGGEVDVTALVRPGKEQRVVLDLTAYPLNRQALTFNAPDRAAVTETGLERKGITGDVFLDFVPQGGRLVNAFVETSVRRKEITFVSEARGSAVGSCVARVREIADASGKERVFKGRGSRFTHPWSDAKIWDTHTPENRYEAIISAYDDRGKLIDESFPFIFGFREIELKGRDIVLNGKVIHLRALYSAHPISGAEFSNKATCLENCRRMKDDGFNCLIAGNYSCAPGTSAYMDAILAACDETGILFSATLPHVKDYGMNEFLKPENLQRYRVDCKWTMDRARNHPSVVLWAMNHNYAGYRADMNPVHLDGQYRPEDFLSTGQTRRCMPRVCAHKAWEIAKELDSTRPCYHHESGNLDDFHTANVYLNWAPRQERSDWLEQWHKKGVKPLFFVEWGMPHRATWSSWRGPEFIWRNSCWQCVFAMEGAAAFLGERAYEDSPEMRTLLRKEEESLSLGYPPRYGTLSAPLLNLTNQYFGVQSYFMSDNWRAHRAWGISALLPWDQECFYRLAHRGEKRPNPRAYRNLKQPGVVPDFFGAGRNFYCDSSPRTDWKRSAVGETLVRWNQPDCAFIGGDEPFTDKSHVYYSGQTIKKTLVVLNDNRESRRYVWSYSFETVGGKIISAEKGDVEVPAGERRDIPVVFSAPAGAGTYRLLATFSTPGGPIQSDAFDIQVMPVTRSANHPDLWLFDPVGLTTANFRRLGVDFNTIDRLSAFPKRGSAVLVVGREALTRELYQHGVMKVSADRPVIVFEQTREVLDSIGFRTQEYGLRQVYLRTRDKRTEGLADELLANWCGESTLTSPYLDEKGDNPFEYIRRSWAGFMNTRVFRCRNRNAVATVIPEKPTCGDWRALVDGGFDLQYAPLLEQRIGVKGSIVFCQLDVTGRTVDCPAADAVVLALVQQANCKRMGLAGEGVAAGFAAFQFLASGLASRRDNQDPRKSRHFLVSDLRAAPKNLKDLVAEGAQAVCVGLNAEQVKAIYPGSALCHDVKGHYFRRIEKLPLELDGLSNGHWAWHGAMDFAAFEDKVEDGNEGIRVVRHGKGKFVFIQVAPWMIDDEAKPYLRATKRRIQETLERVMGNLGFLSSGGWVRYRDLPVPSDDPYRYYRW